MWKVKTHMLSKKLWLTMKVLIKFKKETNLLPRGREWERSYILWTKLDNKSSILTINFLYSVLGIPQLRLYKELLYPGANSLLTRIKNPKLVTLNDWSFRYHNTPSLPTISDSLDVCWASLSYLSVYSAAPPQKKILCITCHHLQLTLSCCKKFTYSWHFLGQNPELQPSSIICTNFTKPHTN